VFKYDPSVEAEHVAVADELTVEVSKVGGGTLGREYVGWWQYRVVMPGEADEFGTFECTVPMSHARAARYVSFYYGADDGGVW